MLVGAAIVAYAVAGALLPKGLPLGVVLLGVVLGALHGLTAMGIVLVYRSTRIINFAQAEIGGLAAALAVLLVTGKGVAYFVAVPVGLAAALAVGAAVDATVVRRVAKAPKLIGTVAMVGVGQILGAGQLVLPHLFTDDLAPFTVYKTPFDFSTRIGPILFRGDHLLAVVASVLVVVTISWFLGRTRLGTGIRAAAEAPERALLAGIPIRRLSTITWVVSAGLSGLAALLSAPIVGVSLGAIAGPSALVIPLTAAVLAKMDNLYGALGAAIAISVVQQGVFWSYPSSSVVDVIILAIVGVGIYLQRSGAIREGGDLAGSAAASEPRRLSPRERRNPAVRGVAIALAAIVALVVLVLPTTVSASNAALLANIAIYCIIALSALVLTGWSGQVSLGQFVFVGVGAAATGALLVETNGDLFLELLIAGLIAAAVAVGIGFFTRRASGIFLGVVTLAAATAFSNYFFSADYFPLWTPARVDRPTLFDRIEIQSSLSFYYLCLAFLLFAVALMRGFRRSYIGRAVIAVRDNERAAAANAIHVGRTKLFAFGFSGFLAGIAGGLYTLSLRGFGYQVFNASESLQIFLLLVIGGLGSMWGAIAGAVYAQGVFYFTSGAAELLGTGAGLLILVLIFPGGLAQAGYALRDRLVRRLAPARGEDDLGLSLTVVAAAEQSAADHAGPADQAATLTTEGTAVLEWSGIEAGYGGVQVLFGASGRVSTQGAVGIVGINGVGKSTLFKTLAGVVPATRGSIRLLGEDITSLSPEARVQRGMVLVVGGAGVFRLLTVDENLRLGAWPRSDGPEAIEATRRRVFDLFPVLERRRSGRAELLSGGEQQMLALGMGLMAEPKVLLVDELSLGLAPLVVDSILDVLNRLQRDGTTIVAVEQSIANAARIVDEVLTMERGRIVRSTSAAEARVQRTLATTTRSEGSRVPTTEGPVVLQVRSVSRRYGGVSAVDDVSLDVPEGQFLGIIGANGAGKTTLLDILSGFVAPDRGAVKILGRDVTGWPPDERAELGMGRVFQHARLFPNLSVRETIALAMSRRAVVREPIAHIVRLPAAVRSEEHVFRQVDDVIEDLGLGRYRDIPTGSLSTGTRRTVELACVIANQPEILLLDEPTAGIGEDETHELAQVLTDLHRSTGATFVMIEHDVDLIARLSDRLVCMEQGHVIADGAPAIVLRDPGVLESYLGYASATTLPEASSNGSPGRRASRLTAAPR
jgi:branched-chain amino acid transport system permease protein